MRFIAFVTFAFLLAAHLSPAEDLAPLKKPTSKPRVIISTDAGGNDADDIRSRLRVHFIGSWNLKQDPFAFEYIDKEHPELFMIHDDTTFRGWYRGGDQSADLGNQSFVSEHIADHGALGNLFASCHAGGVAKGSIKMGDTPTVAYLLRGKRSDPTLPHWGGQFVRHPQRPRWFIDDPSPESAEDPHSGARTVNRWRTDYLRDWQMRMDWCRPITRTE
jgi:hypothetical protein